MKKEYGNHSLDGQFKEKEKKPRRIGLLIIGLILVIIVAVAAVMINRHTNYEQGRQYAEQGNYQAAREAYLAAGNYKDAPALAEEARKADHYGKGVQAFESGAYATAEEEFLAAEDYSDAAYQAEQSHLAEQHRIGSEALARNDFAAAVAALEAAGDYADAPKLLARAIRGRDYYSALEYMEQGDYAAALELLLSVGRYEDAAQYVKECSYHVGVDCMDRGDYAAAVDYLEASDGLSDALIRMEECATILGKSLLKEGDYAQALTYFQKAQKNNDSEELENYVRLCKMEVALNDKALGDAYQLMMQIPHNFDPEEFDMSERRGFLSKYSSFGKWNGIWGSSEYDIRLNMGYQYYYYPAGVLHDMSLLINIMLNEKGTVDIEGTVHFYYIPSPFGGDKTKTISFHIRDQSRLQYSYTLDDNTMLCFNGQYPQVIYQDKDLSATSNVTFNNRRGTT